MVLDFVVVKNGREQKGAIFGWNGMLLTRCMILAAMNGWLDSNCGQICGLDLKTCDVECDCH